MKLSVRTPFSILGSLFTVAALSTTIALFHGMSAVGVAISVSIGWFCYGKLVLAMSFTQGYGVNKTATIAGMPIMLAVFTTIIASLIVLMLATTYQPSGLHWQTVATLRVVGWSAVSGVTTAIFHWYFIARHIYFHVSEYNIRAMCAARGDSAEATQQLIDDYRKRNIVK